jgi:hypothetical protein
MTTSVPCGFPVYLTHVGDGAVVLAVGEKAVYASPEDGCGTSGVGSGQMLTLNGDGTLHWSTRDGWSATLYPYPWPLDG